MPTNESLTRRQSYIAYALGALSHGDDEAISMVLASEKEAAKRLKQDCIDAARSLAARALQLHGTKSTTANICITLFNKETNPFLRESISMHNARITKLPKGATLEEQCAHLTLALWIYNQAINGVNGSKFDLRLRSRNKLLRHHEVSVYHYVGFDSTPGGCSKIFTTHGKPKTGSFHPSTNREGLKWYRSKYSADEHSKFLGLF